MVRTRFHVALCGFALLACGRERPQAADSAAATADTTMRDRPDTSEQRRPSPADTQDGASVADTLKRNRPLGMQRPNAGVAPSEARRDSAPQARE
jgi:hypothetical protein